MLPKDDHLGVKQRVERDAPRALSAPECGAETNKPGTVRRAGRAALLHANGSSVGVSPRQCIHQVRLVRTGGTTPYHSSRFVFDMAVQNAMMKKERKKH